SATPARDPFSYTAAGHEWINLAWLFEAAGALLVRLGGLPLFATACVLVYAFIPVLVFRRALRMGAGLAPALGLTVLAYLVLLSHAIARPHIVTSVFFALVLGARDAGEPARPEAPHRGAGVPEPALDSLLPRVPEPGLPGGQRARAVLRGARPDARLRPGARREEATVGGDGAPRLLPASGPPLRAAHEPLRHPGRTDHRSGDHPLVRGPSAGAP